MLIQKACGFCDVINKKKNHMEGAACMAADSDDYNVMYIDTPKYQNLSPKFQNKSPKRMHLRWCNN